MYNEIMNWFFESLLDNTSTLWTVVCIICGIGVSVFIIEYLKHERQRISLRKRFRHQNNVYRARTHEARTRKN